MKLKFRKRGQAVIGLVLALAGVLLYFTIFIFEINRMQIAQRQLMAISDSAALTGTTMLSCMDIADDDNKCSKLIAARHEAADYARNMINNNYVLGNLINDASKALTMDSLSANLKGGETRYLIALLNEQGDCVDLDVPDPACKKMICYLTYNYQASILKMIHVPGVVITGSSVSGLAKIDVVVAMDLSCAMDDQTVVTFIRREWIHDPRGATNKINKTTPGCGIIQYISLPCRTSPHTIYNYLKGGENKNKTKMSCFVNALPPQNLDQAFNESNGCIKHPLSFAPYLRSHYAHYDGSVQYQLWPAAQPPYYRALDYATPPGNCDLSVALGGNGDGVTDMLGNNPPQGSILPCAFTDTTWQKDNNIMLNAQCAAPRGSQDIFSNDPGVDEQTFTDLVVNIANPATAVPDHQLIRYPYEQALQGPDKFSAFTYTFPQEEPDVDIRGKTFSFPNIAVVVEAARGNLERTPVLPTGVSNFQMALLDRPVLVDGQVYAIDPHSLQDGYQKAYQRLAMMFSQPIATVLSTTDQAFFQLLHQEANCRFGFVGFSSKNSFDKGRYPYDTTEGTMPDASVNPPNKRSFYVFCPAYCEPSYSNPVFFCGKPTEQGLNDNKVTEKSTSQMDTSGFRIPRTALDVNHENYFECLSQNSVSKTTTNSWSYTGAGANGLYNCRPLSVCDVSEAMKTAYAMFHSKNYDVSIADTVIDLHNRPTAHKAIVLIMASEPTDGIEGVEAKAAAAVVGPGPGTCHSDGIAVYTIGLNLDNDKKLHENLDKFLGENNNGLAALAHYGSKYFACTSAKEMKESFSSIARQKTFLQR